MSEKNIVIWGATSGIAHAVSREYAKLGACLHLVGRNEERLKTLALDLKSYGAKGVTIGVGDLSKSDEQANLVEGAARALNSIDVSLVSYGILGSQDRADSDLKHAEEILSVNFNSTALLCLRLAERLKKQGSGVLAVIGSVAGDRGRQSNFVYGSAKAGLHAFLSGLRNRLFAHGVHVLTIKPGFVSTPMTAGFKKGLLWAEPEAIAPVIVQAISKRKDVIYVPFFWRFIMLVIRSIPERIFKKLKL
jgi:decaprenylphospho-beta-D-erythro-pentofuranosid-2-ulose 2-reductase